MKQSEFLRQVEEYKAMPDALAEAVYGLTKELLTARPGPGLWSIHEVVVHCLDSDLTSIDRMKRTVAMDEPALLAYDESAFIELLHPHKQRLDDTITILRMARRLWCDTLIELTDNQLDRVGQHSEDGPVTVRDMVPKYTEHIRHHIRFIQQKRERLGVPV